MIIKGYLFLFLHKNICCGYSGEAILMSTHNKCHRGDSNEYPQHMNQPMRLWHLLLGDQ